MPRSSKSGYLVPVLIGLSVVSGLVIYFLKGPSGANGDYSVIDGDTIEYGDVGPVRYIGIDAPEREEAYYDDARSYNEELLSRGEVTLSYGSERRDRYGRTLAYVFVQTEEGRLLFVNEEMVRAGWARTLEVPPIVEYAPRLRRVEEAARRQGRGIWATEGPGS